MLREKADGYVEEGILTAESAALIMRVIESERGMSRTINDGEDEDVDEPAAAPARTSLRMTRAEMKEELDKRMGQLQEGLVEGITDQWHAPKCTLAFGSCSDVLFSFVFCIMCSGFVRLATEARLLSHRRRADRRRAVSAPARSSVCGHGRDQSPESL